MAGNSAEQSQRAHPRIPMIIGNYPSHPREQAAFRVPDERELFTDPGISLI
jgi:hypothetical protein